MAGINEERPSGDLGLYIYHFRYIILAFLFIVLLGAVFEVGRRFECINAGGYRYAGKCVGIANLTVCESKATGNLYILNNTGLTDVIPITHDNNEP